ncbi:MAG: hypothetical protein ABI688_04705 [Bacteroidota bacterium]
MSNKMPKQLSRVLLGFLVLAFTVAACNSKKKEDKMTTMDTTVVQQPLPPKMDTLPTDTLKKKPVKDPNN